MLRNAPAALRRAMAETNLLWGPGVYDGISARIAAQVGFPIQSRVGCHASG